MHLTGGMRLLLLLFYMEHQECFFRSDIAVRTTSRETDESRNPCAIVLPQASYGPKELYEYSANYVQIQHDVYRKIRLW